MSGAARRSIRGLLPSIGDFAWLLPIVFLFGRMGGAKALLGDGDTGWHIRTGEWILANGRVPRVDMFSFTKPGQPWYAWEWLSDVLMGYLHQVGGMQAVLLGAILILCLTSALLYRLIYRQSGSVTIAFALTVIAAGGSSIHWLARPHLFTMLFLVIFYSLLEEKRMRLLFILPVATVIWTNLHGGFFVGILLLGAYAGGEAISALLAEGTEDRLAAVGRSWRYGLTALGCLAASFVNPYTWHLHAHMFRYLSDPAYTYNISEFLSINFRHPAALFFEAMLLLGAATGLWSLMRRRFVPFLLLAGWAHLALQSGRNIPLFIIVAAPPVGLALAEWLRLLQDETAGGLLHGVFRGLNSLSGRLNAAAAGTHWHVAGPAAVCVLGALLFGHEPSARFRAEYDPQAFPVAALSALRGSDRIFTSDTWGGYLIYRRYPAKVFIDGRSDFYGPAFVAEYVGAVSARYDWESVLNRNDIDTVLLAVDAPLASSLKASGRWRAVYDDRIAIVFRATAVDRPAPATGRVLVAEVETESQKRRGSKHR